MKNQVEPEDDLALLFLSLLAVWWGVLLLASWALYNLL